MGDSCWRRLIVAVLLSLSLTAFHDDIKNLQTAPIVVIGEVNAGEKLRASETLEMQQSTNTP